MNIDVLNKTTLGCADSLGKKGTEFTIVAGKITEATNHYSRKVKILGIYKRKSASQPTKAKKHSLNK